MISLGIKEITKCRVVEVHPLIIHVVAHLGKIFTIIVLVIKSLKMQEINRDQGQADSKISLKIHPMQNLQAYHVALKVRWVVIATKCLVLNYQNLIKLT